MPSSSTGPGQTYVPWDPDPVIALGNAWISFGNTLDANLATMASSQFNLGDGSWDGDASVGMAGAFGALESTTIQVINSCWDMGESINYYAMLRSQQEATEAKEWLKEG